VTAPPNTRLLRAAAQPTDLVSDGASRNNSGLGRPGARGEGLIRYAASSGSSRMGAKQGSGPAVCALMTLSALAAGMSAACDTAFTRRSVAPVPDPVPQLCVLAPFSTARWLDSSRIRSLEPRPGDSTSLWIGGLRYRGRDLLTTIRLRPNLAHPDTLEIEVFALGLRLTASTSGFAPEQARS
jgi:hypothetical protein